MTHNYMYVFECDYGSRIKERPFVKDILRDFDKDYATMVGAIVNNNPYCFSFNIVVNLQGNPVRFESWLREKYPDKAKRYNIFLKDAFRFNLQTFVNETDVDSALTEEASNNPLFHLFLFPEKLTFEKNNPQFACLSRNESKVFLSHSSKDKELIVNPLNAYLQANNIATWLDSYEIDYGDNIYLKVDEGIKKSDVGLFILTDNFFDSASGWPMAEFSTFFMGFMKNNKKVLMLNAGVSSNNMPAMMSAYKYISWENGAGISEVANAINKLINI